MKHKLVWVRKIYSQRNFEEVKKLYYCGHKIHFEDGFWFVEVLTDPQTANTIVQSNKLIRTKHLKNIESYKNLVERPERKKFTTTISSTEWV